MKRLTVLMIVIILIICATISYYYFNRQKTVILEDISEQARAYIESQRTNDKSEWKLKNIGRSKEEVILEPQSVKETFFTECYKIVIPFPIIKSEVMGGCVLDISTQDPRGRIVVMLQEVGAAHINEADQVIMRRASPETYNESKEEINGREFIVFKTKQEIYERAAFTYFDSKVLSISFFTANNANYDGVFLDIVKSLVLDE